VTPEEIRERYTYHPPSQHGVDAHTALSEACIDLAQLVEDTCPNCREKSLAHTHLQQVKMFASAAIALDPNTR
jgi:hypothetical protein